MQKFLVLSAFIAVSACAQATDAINSDVTPLKLQTSTADYFDTSNRYVRVGNMQQSVMGTAYQARVGGKVYDCRYFRSVVTCDRAT